MAHPLHPPTPSRFAPYIAIAGLLWLLAAWPLGAWGNADLTTAFLLASPLALGPLLWLAHHCPRRGTRLRLYTLILLGACTLATQIRGAETVYATQAAGMLGLLLLALGLWHWPQAVHRLPRLMRALAVLPQNPRRFAALISLALLGMAVWLSWTCFGFLPAVMDSTAQYVHGKIMAAGQLYGPEHPLRQFFPLWMVVPVPKFYAQYQPLHIMLLGLGHLAHAPFLVNPLSACITSLATYALARRIFGTPTARIAALFMLGSQFILFMSAEYMNHATALCACSLFMLAYTRTLDAARPRATWYGLATGLALGAIFLIRPFTAIGIGLPFVVHGLYRLRCAPRRYGPAFACASLAVLATIAFQLWYNHETSDDMWMFPSAAYHYRKLSSAMGFGAGTPFSVEFVVKKAQNEWWLLNRALFEWPVPSLLLFALYILRPARNPYARLLLASVFTHTLLNTANQFYSGIFGPRYMYETSEALIILSAAGLMRLPILLSALKRSYPRKQLRALCQSLCLLLFAIAFAERFPTNQQAYSRHYIDNNPALYRAMLAQSEKPALIFMGRAQSAQHTNRLIWQQAYRSVSFTYPPSPEDAVIFAQDKGDEENKKLIAYYPGRHNYTEADGILTPVPAP